MLLTCAVYFFHASDGQQTSIVRFPDIIKMNRESHGRRQAYTFIRRLGLSSDSHDRVSSSSFAEVAELISSRDSERLTWISSAAYLMALDRSLDALFGESGGSGGQPAVNALVPPPILGVSLDTLGVFLAFLHDFLNSDIFLRRISNYFSTALYPMLKAGLSRS